MSAASSSLGSFPWIDAQFVQNLVNKSESGDKWTVASYYNGSLDNEGQNFSSDTIRLIVNLRCLDNAEVLRKSYFMKICMKSLQSKTVADESLLFEKEIEVYSRILPAAEDLLRSIDVPATLAPRCYFTDIGRKVLVFEDLRGSEFVHSDKLKGFDVDHMRLCLKWLAKWHATTAVLLEEREDLFEWTTKVMYKDSPTILAFFKNIATGISSVIRPWDGFERIAEKLVNLPDHAYTEIYKEYMPLENGFNVLLHSDLWTNNILFHYDEQNALDDIRLVDFALCKHTRPTIDLALLLYANGDQSITQDHREQLIQFYHGELKALLEKLKYPKKMPTLLDIQLAAYNMDLYTALAILLCTGLRFADTSFEGGSMEMSENIGPNGTMYTNPECQRQLKQLLHMFDRRGYFDF